MYILFELFVVDFDMFYKILNIFKYDNVLICLIEF